MAPTWTGSDIRETTDNVYKPGWSDTTIDREAGGETTFVQTLHFFSYKIKYYMK